MKRLIYFAIACLLVAPAFSQSGRIPSSVKPDKVDYEPLKRQLLKGLENTPVTQSTSISTTSPASANKTAGLMDLEKIGRASNAYTILRNEQNQVYTNQQLNLIGFIHRQDVSIFGGGTANNGKYRYDLSIDGGASFSNNIGILNDTYTYASRYPNITGFNFSGTGSGNPLDTRFIYVGPTLDGSWDGQVSGVTHVVTSGAPTTTENYDFKGTNTLLQGGLVEGAEGDFWYSDFPYDGTNVITGELAVYKGRYDDVADDIKFHKTILNYTPFTEFDGTASQVGPNMAFSEDGMIGYLVWSGDIEGQGMYDTVYNPCYMKTSDGGATWGDATEMDMTAIPALQDAFADAYWTSSIDSGALGNSIFTTGFDFDCTVDANGDLHFFSVVGHSAQRLNDPDEPEDETERGYSILSGMDKYVVDIHTSDNALGFDAAIISPLLGFRGAHGTPSDGSDPLTIDNFCQVSKTEDGTKIFYSWTDSDGSNDTCWINDNDSPDLRIAGMDVVTGKRTYIKKVSDQDIVYQGKILTPTMAPTVLMDDNQYHLPIVFMEMLLDDPLSECQFIYVGRESFLAEEDFVDAGDVMIAYGAENNPCFCIDDSTQADEIANCPVEWGGSDSTVVGIDVEMVQNSSVSFYNAFPNPAKDELNVLFEMNRPANVAVKFMNLNGQTIKEVANSQFNIGTHSLQFSTSDIAAGVYVLSIETGTNFFNEKIVIIK